MNLKHLLMLLGLTLFLTSCSGPRYEVKDPQKPMEFDGASFLPPRGEWKYRAPYYYAQSIYFEKKDTKSGQHVECIIALHKLPAAESDTEEAFLESIEKERMWLRNRSGNKFELNEFRLTYEKNALCVRDHSVYKDYKSRDIPSGTQYLLSEIYTLTCKHPDENNIFELGISMSCYQQSRPEDFIENFEKEAEYFFRNTVFEPLKPRMEDETP